MKANQELNHTAAHLLAAAVLSIYPDAKYGFGPAIDEGFYYDFRFDQPITEADLRKFEKRMHKIVSGGFTMEQVEEVDLSHQPFKQELIKEFTEQGKEITYWGMIHPASKKSLFTDLCKGGHYEKGAKGLKHFKLLSTAGAYWRGNSDNEQLVRIYGTAWETKEELDAYLQLIEERKERDHRKIGKEMGIFMFDKMAGQGFPIYLFDGMIVKREIQNYILDMDKKYGFTEVQTPAFGEVSLYETSGHWAHYKDDMFNPVEVENERLVMRPMTCPHHLLIFNSKRRSYRELPIRFSEQARLYRYEKSGALTGLERVRSMELTEGHILARPDQVIAEFENSYRLIQEVLEKFKIEIDYVSLSLRDPEDKEKYFDNDEMWETAENDLRKVLADLNIEYTEMIGEAAFYGPKIDIQVKTVLGHEITLSTLQLDFLLPERFDATYVNENEEKVRPVMIHRGLIGTYERFIATLLEQTKGDLPFWIAPRQITIIPVNSQYHQEYADEVYKKFTDLGYRVHMDDRNERLGKKIRDAQTSKTKFQFVIGDNEVENKNINVRAYGEKEQKSYDVDEFISKLEVLKQD